MTRKTLISAWMLAGLLFLVLLAVLVTPSVEQGRPYSSYSAGSNGVKLSRDLIDRLGWQVEARVVPFTDTTSDPAPVQVLVNANVSESEARHLLTFVRNGGGLLVAGGAGTIWDSLGLTADDRGMIAEVEFTPNCASRGTWRTELAEPGYAASIDATRPLSPDTVGFGTIGIAGGPERPARRVRAAIGMPYGTGRVVVIGDQRFLANDVIRRCETEADVEFVRMIQYLSRGRSGVRVAFDEYHHGYGARGGSFTAIRMYLGGTPSGRMLTQLLAGGLLLLFAAAPRPLAPRDPSHVARRSPLEHADALAHAYAGVRATRTAVDRLLAGVRRRARSRGRARDTDEAFLTSAAATSPTAGKAAQTIAAALEAPVPESQLPEIAAALDTLERELTRRPISPTR